MVEKRPRPTKEMSPKLFTAADPAAAGGGAAKKSFELKGQEAGLVRSTDVFNDGAAFKPAEKTAPIVDWDALAAHARTANKPLTLGEIFSRDGRYYFISRPLLITLTAGLIGGVLISCFSYLTDRIPYQHYSDRGYQLLNEKNPRPAFEYFLAQSNSTEMSTFSCSP